MTGINLQHMEALADLFFQNLTAGYGEGYGIGLDGKRPFGFSGYHAIGCDILEAMGIEPDDEGGYTDKQVEYAHHYYGLLPDWLAEEWERRKPATPKNDAEPLGAANV